MAGDPLLDGERGQGPNEGSGAAILLVALAFVVLFVGAILVLDLAFSDKEGETYGAGSPRAVCHHLWNEIPIDATEFDPALNEEYRSCIGREHLERYALAASPFIVIAALLLIAALRSKRRHGRRGADRSGANQQS